MTSCRILFVLHSEVRGGLEEHVLSLLQSLSPEHFTLGLACPPALVAAMAPELDALPVKVFPVEPVRWTSVRTICQLWHALQQFRPDIVHCHLFRATLVGAPLARAAKIPLVVETYHGREVWRQGLVKGQFVVDRLVSHCVDHIIAVSKAAARFLVECKGISAGKISVIPNGRNLEDFEPSCDRVRTTIRQRLDVPDTTPLLGVVGRLEAQKGHRFLLAALPAILAEFPHARLLLIGDGSLQHNLAAQAEQLGIRHAVIFAGFQSNVPAYMAAADVMVLPSLYEGLPLTAIEAAAMGKPIVATDVDGTPEVVRHATTGLLVPPAAPAALAEAILTLLRQPALTSQYGVAAQAWVRQQFDLRRQVAETENLYLQLLATQKR